MTIKAAVAIGVALLFGGLLIGYVWWGRPPSTAPAPDVVKELADARARLAEQTQRAEEAQKKVTDLEAEFTRAMDALRREREERERLHELVSKGQK